MPFSLRKTETIYDIEVDKTLLVQVNEVKFLGMDLDSALNWKKHICELTKKLNSANFVLRQLKQTVKREILIKVYYALVYSKMVYGINAWGLGNKDQMDKIFSLQKTSIRIINDMDYLESCREAFIDLKLLTLPAICVYFSVTNLIKAGKGTRHSNIHKHETRNKDDFNLKQYRGAFGNKDPLYMAQRFYNKLPTYIKSQGSYNKFKKDLKLYLVKQGPYDLENML